MKGQMSLTVAAALLALSIGAAAANGDGTILAATPMNTNSTGAGQPAYTNAAEAEGQYNPASMGGPVGTPYALAGAEIVPTGIDTTPSWNGSQSVCCFAYPDSATYGQTITAPVSGASLQSFTFYMNLPASCTFQGEVYAWDGIKATGPALWEGPSMHTSGSGSFEAITFTPGGVPLAPSAQYVIFASLSKQSGSGGGSWGSIITEAYSGGDFVYINNGNDPSQWTSMPWTITWPSAQDLAFKVVFGTGFDLSFQDDYGRSMVCVNSKTGDWQYNVLSGLWKGVYTGKSSISKTADRWTFRSVAGSPRLMLLTFYPQMFRATASLGGSDFVSQLSDRNTKDDPAGCPAN